MPNLGQVNSVYSLLEYIGKRWALRLLWELGNGPATSRMLRSRCGVSPSVLQTRVDELRTAGLVDSGENGYELTVMGQKLVGVLSPLNEFSDLWAKELHKEAA